ncbi:MAG: DUF2283 domain-containing protein [Treponemataceae bacterium]
MTIKIDNVADAAYIRLVDGVAYESEEVADGVVLDYDDSGRLVAIELLDISKNLPGGVFSKVEVLPA